MEKDRLIAESPVMKGILEDVLKIAKSNASVLLCGESGTGKEVIAHTIHNNSGRKSAPFIKVNCAAIPETLIESEFFGHERGAFTGAHSRRIGRFELAHTGTLLLDEITEIPLGVQAKLLRAIQEQEFERVGGSLSVDVDVRLISTSNRDLKEAIEQKFFREDLFYRLNVVPLSLPPLRERKEDIVPLAEYFLSKLAPEKELSNEAKWSLESYIWPGNIRELANVIERTVVMASGELITPDHLGLNQDNEFKKCKLPVGMTLQELEKRMILETLESNKNNRTKTAKILGISVRTLYNKLSSYTDYSIH